MKQLTLKVQAMAGSEIRKVYSEAIELSSRIGCNIEFNFNGVTCFAVSGGSAEEGERQYHIAITKEHGFAHCLK